MGRPDASTEPSPGTAPASLVLTGISGGIGSAVARRLNRDRWHVIGLDLGDAPPAGLPIDRYLAADLTAPDTPDRLIAALAEAPPVAALVSAAGLYPRRPLPEYDRTGFDRVMGANFTGLFWLIQALLPRLLAAEAPRIVVVTSQAGATGGTDPVYAAAKAACTALVKSLAREYAAQGLAINAVAPGPVATPMAAAAMSAERRAFYETAMPIKRFVAADEVADVILFLLGLSHPAATGSTYDIDGGLVRR